MPALLKAPNCQAHAIKPIIMKWKRYNSLVVAAVALLALSFKYQGEGVVITIDDPNSYVSFALIWQIAACFLAVLWIFYILFDRQLNSEILTRIHVVGSLFCALLTISYPLWMNYFDRWMEMGLSSIVFLLTQSALLINLVKGTKSLKVNAANTGLPK